VLPYTARALAEIRGEDAVQVAEAVTANAVRAYRLPSA
jgi:TatD DNase family protein